MVTLTSPTFLVLQVALSRLENYQHRMTIGLTKVSFKQTNMGKLADGLLKTPNCKFCFFVEILVLREISIL